MLPESAESPRDGLLTIVLIGDPSVYDEKRACDVEDGRITDDFAPFAVHIYRLSPPR